LAGTHGTPETMKTEGTAGIVTRVSSADPRRAAPARYPVKTNGWRPSYREYAAGSPNLDFQMPDDPLLSTDALTRRVDGDVLVDNVSVEVERGEVFVVFGPSGAGKSSLLRLLNRLDEPSSGTVYLDGTDYRDVPPTQLRRRIGLVPQRPTLTDGTVADNVAWGPRLRGEPVDTDRLHALLDRLGLDGVAGRDAADLSGGEAQRVAIARTLFNEPDALLLDEPASSLDAEAAGAVETLIRDVMDAFSLAAVLVTHDADRAVRLGTRGVRLANGRVTHRGDVSQVVGPEATARTET